MFLEFNNLTNVQNWRRETMCLNTAHVFHGARFIIKYIVESSWNKDVNTYMKASIFPSISDSPSNCSCQWNIQEQGRREGGSVAPGSASMMAPKKVKFRNYLLLWNSILCSWWKVQIIVVPSHLKLFPAINFNSYEHLNIYWGGACQKKNLSQLPYVCIFFGRENTIASNVIIVSKSVIAIHFTPVTSVGVEIAIYFRVFQAVRRQSRSTICFCRLPQTVRDEAIIWVIEIICLLFQFVFLC